MADLEKMFKELMVKFDGLTKELDAERQNRIALEERMLQTEQSIPDLASDIEEIARRNAIAEANPSKPVLKNFSGYKYDKKTDSRTEIPFTGKKDCCPYCTEHGQKSMLDLTKSGRWACRSCGKHWYEEALGQKYSLKLEQYIREGDGKDPLQDLIAAEKKELDDERVQKLEAELAELKMLIIKGGLVNGSKSA